jgi:hypothetical protein
MSRDSDVSGKTDSSPFDRDPSPAVRARDFARRPVFTKLETFLGFDVVTREEIVKIFITGTIAGFGVAAMRKVVCHIAQYCH